MKIKFLTTGMSTFLAILTASPLATAVSPSAETVLDDLTTTTNSITFQGDNYSLLDTYVSANDARRIYTTRYADALNEIQDQEMLPPLDPHSASSYKQVVIAKSTNTRENMEPLVEFLDIYENSEENAQIVDHLNKLEIQIANNELTREDASIQARILLPSKPENGNEQLSYSTRNSGINLTNARAYARKWAVNINPKYGEEKTGGVSL